MTERQVAESIGGSTNRRGKEVEVRRLRAASWFRGWHGSAGEVTLWVVVAVAGDERRGSADRSAAVEHR